MRNLLFIALVVICLISFIPYTSRVKHQDMVVDKMSEYSEHQGVVVIDIDNLLPFQGKLYDNLEFKYSYVPGVDKDKFTISGWEYFRVDENNNFLVVNRYTHTVKLFNLNSKKVTNIGKEGNNPFKGEYQKLSYSDFSSVNNEIFILNSTSGKIFKYDYGGKFKDFVDLERLVNSDGIIKINNQFINDVIYLNSNGELLIYFPWWIGANKNKYLIIDSNNNVVFEKEMQRNFTGIANSIIARSGFNSYIYDGRIHIVNLSDTVYQVDNAHLSPKYHFKQKYSINNLIDSLGNDVDIYNIGYLPVYEFKIVETDEYLIFKYLSINIPPYGEREVKYGVYDKKTHISYGIKDENLSFHTKDSISIMKILFSKNVNDNFYTTLKSDEFDSYDIIKLSIVE